MTDPISSLFRPALFFLIATLLALVVFPARAQIFKLPQPDTTRGNFFGVSVSIDGDRALVGASAENSCGDNSGAAYIFERDSLSGDWQIRAKITPDDCEAKQFFGRAVSLSGDRALITAFRPFFSTVLSNAAYVFERDSLSGEWKQAAKLTANNSPDEGPFAASVSLDGDRALITSSGDPSNNTYNGAAYIFERTLNGRWKKTARLTGSGGIKYGIFGTSGALKGNRVAVSASTYFANKPGSVYVFEYDPSARNWKETARIGGIRDFFISIDIDGNRLIVGQSKGGHHDAGMASIYERVTAGKWRLMSEVSSSTPYKDGGFGTAVAIRGNRALVVGFDEQLSLDINIDRVVYVFEYIPETKRWDQIHIIDVGNVAFGSAIDLDNGQALIGQASEQQPGLAYVVAIH